MSDDTGSDPAKDINIYNYSVNPKGKGKSDLETFKTHGLTALEHQDQSKHYIGEALPVPSVGEIRNTGAINEVGTSPFPSRSDHRHQISLPFTSGFTPNSLTVGAGAGGFLSGFVEANTTYPNYEDWLTSGQVITVPYKGVYSIFLSWFCKRSAGGVFPAPHVDPSQCGMHVRLYRNGSAPGAGGYNVYLGGNPSSGISPNHFDSYVLTVLLDALDTLQVHLTHNDSASNWDMQFTGILVFLLSGAT